MVATGWGKVILLGEHAVVYGHPALAAALDRGVTARCRPADRLRLRVPAWNIDVAAGDDHPVATALAAIAAEVGAPIQGDGAAVAIDADAAIPPAAGLGSSAGLAVALARALGAHATGQPLADDRVAEVADAAERCFHRRPSGVDVALATRGGLGVFRRGAGLAPLVAPPLTIVIGLSGEPRSTAEMVERVATSCGGDGADPRLVELGAAAAAGAEHVAAGALDRLGPLMTAAHRTLATFGVSTPALDGLVDAALGAGALGAKLTGAGGGGAVIAIAPGREADVLAAWQRRGVTGFVATLRS